MIQPPQFPAPLGIVIMGVSGSGKSTLGKLLAESLSAPFLEGDDYHPLCNLEKMRSGIALEDGDRWSWLESLGRAIGSTARAYGHVVASCSALKRSYRNRLRDSAAVPLFFVCLVVDPKVLDSRMRVRTAHFMPASLLASQLATLEPPDSTEAALCVSANEPMPGLLAAIMDALSNLAASVPRSGQAIPPGKD